MYNEKVYTPERVVNIILDEIGFNKTENIKDKHIIDNSCGNGNFIIKIVERIIDKVPNVDKTYLETYVHGIDIDSNAVEECKERVNEYCSSKGIEGGGINWDIRVSNSLTDRSYVGKMDYVVGNPPYCNVHHLDWETYNLLKTHYYYCQDSMTDLYLAFFEVGIEMMKSEGGRLGYITPNSWLTSKAAKILRQELVKADRIEKIIDFKTDKVFPNATTFTNITILDNKHKGKAVYYYNGELKDYMFNKTKMFSSIEQAYVNEQLFFNKNIDTVKDIINYDCGKDKQYSVKNGLATLKDKLFIIDNIVSTMNIVDNIVSTMNIVDNYSLDSQIINCIKASTAKNKFIIYPYDKNGKPLKYEDICGVTRGILEERAEKLEIDTTKEDWYLYGRTQALNDVSKYKVSVNNIIKTRDDIRVCKAQKNVAVYSGFYIIENGMEQTDEAIEKLQMFVESAMKSELFFEYLNVVGKAKNGGYYSFTTKDLEKFLNYFVEISQKRSYC